MARLRVAVYPDGIVVEEAERPRLMPGDGQRDVEAMLGRFVDVGWTYRLGPAVRSLVVASLEDPASGGAVVSRSFHHPLGRTRSDDARCGQRPDGSDPGHDDGAAIVTLGPSATPTGCGSPSPVTTPTMTGSASSRDARTRCASGRGRRGAVGRGWGVGTARALTSTVRRPRRRGSAMMPHPVPTWLSGGAEPVFAVHHPADPDAPAGGPVLIVPPWGWHEVASYRSRRTWAGHLADRGHDVLRIDLPGTGSNT